MTSSNTPNDNIRIESSGTYRTGGHVATVPTEYAAFRRIRWGAVFAGTLIALVTMAALNLLGIGIGLASFNPATEANPLAGLGTGAIVWYVVSSLLSLFVGGYVAGHVSGFPKKSNSGLHGLLSWGLFTIVSLYLFTTTMGRVVSGVGSAISGVTTGVSNTVAAAIPDNLDQQIANEINLNNVSLNDVRREVFSLLEDADKPALDPDNLQQDANQLENSARRNYRQTGDNPFSASQQINDVIDRVQAKGSNVLEAADQEALVNIIVERTDLSRSEARQRVNQMSSELQQATQTVQQEARQLKNTAAEVGGQVADGLATAAILGFVGLLLGALASYFGGVTGRQTDLTLTNGQSISGVETSHK